MSQGGYVTLVGFVAREPRIRQVTEGRFVADLRVGATTRKIDQQTGEWVDGDTSYYTVNCWRRLAGHVKASLRKGDPVVVKGKFRTHSYEDRAGRLRTEVEIVADTVGHDLTRGIANYMRPERPAVASADESAADGPEAVAEDQDIIDEEAIQRFGRELDEGLDDGELAGQALDDGELAAQALEEDETASAAPPVPF
jgi:single-strand DNA-binding protein